MNLAIDHTSDLTVNLCSGIRKMVISSITERQGSLTLTLGRSVVRLTPIINWELRLKWSYSSFRYRLRHCVNSPLGHRTQLNITPYQLGCTDTASVTFRRQNGHHYHHHHPQHQQIESSSNNSMCYEMSTDLLQKQLELLCRRYGGVQRAARAARIIQRAYRQHALVRNFERVGERRLVNQYFYVFSIKWDIIYMLCIMGSI